MQYIGFFDICEHQDKLLCILGPRQKINYSTLHACWWNLLSWKIKQTVVQSSSEDKYQAMAIGCCDLLWLKILLQELDIIRMDLWSYIVILLLHFLLFRIQCITSELSILRLIFIFIKKVTKKEIWLSMRADYDCKFPHEGSDWQLGDVLFKQGIAYLSAPAWGGVL